MVRAERREALSIIRSRREKGAIRQAQGEQASKAARA